MATRRRTRARRADGERPAGAPVPGVGRWYDWGPYLSDPAPGVVRSQAYRWGEAGLAGLCDRQQRMRLALALWNGRDPMLNERVFGPTGEEHWCYLDAVPSHTWLRWRHPYVGGGRHWIIDVAYARVPERRGADLDRGDLLMRIGVGNAGPEPAVLHVLPTLSFRDTWSWSAPGRRPALWVLDGALVGEHPDLGRFALVAGAGTVAPPSPLFCENETNTSRRWGLADGPRYPEDGINDHVVGGAATVNPALVGTKAAWWYRVPVAPGATAELRLRLTRGHRPRDGRDGPRRPSRRRPRPAAGAVVDAVGRSLGPAASTWRSRLFGTGAPSVSRDGRARPLTSPG
jgi:hypothetical protein